jgi:hypothetical protein
VSRKASHWPEGLIPCPTICPRLLRSNAPTSVQPIPLELSKVRSVGDVPSEMVAWVIPLPRGSDSPTTCPLLVRNHQADLLLDEMIVGRDDQQASSDVEFRFSRRAQKRFTSTGSLACSLPAPHWPAMLRRR